MKLKTFILLLFFPIYSSAQAPCDSLVVDFPTTITTETHFLSVGDTIFTQDTFFVDLGTYTFYYQSLMDCDSLVQVSIYAPEVADDFMYLEDTVFLNGTGCGVGYLTHCFQFQRNVHGEAACILNGEDIGMFANSTCFTLFVFGFTDIDLFPNNMNSYPLHVLSMVDNLEGNMISDFYVNSPLELIHKMRGLVPGSRIWINENGNVVVADDVGDPANYLSISTTISTENDEELIFDINTGLVVDEITNVISIPSLPLFLHEGENVLEIYDPNSNQGKTIILNFDYTEPEVHADYYTYEMPLGQTAIFPLNSNDLCEEIISIENNCPELSENGAVTFTLQSDHTVKFKAEKLGTSHACYKMCEQSGRCDTFTLRVDVFEPDLEPVEEIPTPEDSLSTHNLYPNPAFSIIHFTEPLDVFIKKITIYSSAGKLEDEHRLVETNTYDLDVSRYAEGLYIAVRHLENGEIFVEKFVVQR